MFQQVGQSNCVAHIQECFLRRRFQQTKSVKWIGFDRYEKFLYGIEFVECNKWKIRKMNIFTKTTSDIKTVQFDKFMYLNANLNEFGDQIAVIGYNDDLIANMDIFEFCLISVETGEILKTYDVTFLSPVSYSNVEKVELIRFGTNSWIVKCYFPAINTFYFHLRLDHIINEGYLEYITSCHIDSWRGNTDIIWDRKILFTGVPDDQAPLGISVRMYDFQLDLWSDEKIALPFFDIHRTEFGFPVGFDSNHFYSISIDSKSFYKFSLDQTQIRLNIPYSYMGFGYPFYGFTTSNLFFFCHLADDIDKGRVECLVLNHDVLSLKDLAMRKICDHCQRNNFASYSERKICDILQLPHTLVRHYFGPDWTLN